MGRMKEKFLEEQQQANFDLQDRMIDDEYCCEQQCECHEENEANVNAASYDAWWDSLTDDQKEELFKDQAISEKEMLDQLEQTGYRLSKWEDNTLTKTDDLEGPNASMGV